MTTTNPTSAVTSLLWVEMTAPGVAKHWARTCRLLTGVSQAERENILSRLRAGQTIAYEAYGISLQCPLMPPNDQKRLAHLERFEESGFKLTTFCSNSALFHKNGHDYYCMREMSERGFLPTSAIAVDGLNTAVTTFDGRLIDVFVPIGRATVNFFSR